MPALALAALWANFETVCGQLCLLPIPFKEFVRWLNPILKEGLTNTIEKKDTKTLHSSHVENILFF